MTSVEVDRGNVLVVDDQEPFRHAAKSLVVRIKRFTTVAEAGSAQEALAIAARLPLDLVIMDVRLPDIDGVEATRRLLELSPSTVVILVSTYSASDLPDGLHACGAAGFLPKEELTASAILNLFDAQGKPGSSS